MTEVRSERCLFFTVLRSVHAEAKVSMLVDSLRSFGGFMAGCPIWIFTSSRYEGIPTGISVEANDFIPLPEAEGTEGYPFAEKVLACSLAERMAAGKFQTIIWIAPDCLIIRPPQLLDLGSEVDAAVRPVHLQNIGLTVDEPLNGYWGEIYNTLGSSEPTLVVESFVDARSLRPYFNTHAFAITPDIGLAVQWFEEFQALVLNRNFQKDFCADLQDKVFLHQAVWSALLATALDRDRMRVLPSEYNYPYNLQAIIPEKRKVGRLNELVTIAYEERPLDPVLMDDIEVDEPLRTWLLNRSK